MFPFQRKTTPWIKHRAGKIYSTFFNNPSLEPVVFYTSKHHNSSFEVCLRVVPFLVEASFPKLCSTSAYRPIAAKYCPPPSSLHILPLSLLLPLPLSALCTSLAIGGKRRQVFSRISDAYGVNEHQERSLLMKIWEILIHYQPKSKNINVLWFHNYFNSSKMHDFKAAVWIFKRKFIQKCARSC